MVRRIEVHSLVLQPARIAIPALWVLLACTTRREPQRDEIEQPPPVEAAPRAHEEAPSPLASPAAPDVATPSVAQVADAPVARTDDWIRTHAVPLAGLDPGTSNADLAPLRALVADARLIGLGEPTSGSHEGFQLKRRVFEHLVAEFGFRVLALDVGWLEARALDEYVTEGKGSASTALIALERLDWTCNDALELVEWIRRWNSEPERTEKIRIRGLDVQRTRTVAEQLLAFMRKVDPDRAAHVNVFLAPYRLVDVNGEPNFTGVSPDFAAAITYALADLLTSMAEHQEDYVKASSTAEWLHALQCAAAIAQADELLQSPDREARAAVHARVLSEYLREVVERSGAEARIVLWTANEHLDRGRAAGLAAELEELFPGRWRALAMTFGSGEVRGIESAPERRLGDDLPPKPLGLRYVSFPVAPPDAVETLLARCEAPLAWFDLRELPAQEPLGQPRPMRSRVVAVPGTDVPALETVALGKAFDALFWVRTVTPARGMPLNAIR